MVTRSKIDFRLGLRVPLPRTLDKGRREVQTFGSGCCQQRLRDITKSRRSASRVRPRLPHRTPPCDTHHHQVKILVVIIERSIPALTVRHTTNMPVRHVKCSCQPGWAVACEGGSSIFCLTCVCVAWPLSTHAARGAANTYDIVLVPGVTELKDFPVNQIDGLNGTNSVPKLNWQA